MLDPDQSWRNLQENKNILVEENEKNLNEANTRLKIIDTLFIDVLGWEKNILK